MGGFFGAVAHQDVTLDIFFGVDYHSHLGTRRGGMLIYDEQDGFQRQIHSIENTPFRTKFEKDLSEFHGNCGIGCISDTDPQPLLVRSHLGMYAITTVAGVYYRQMEVYCVALVVYLILTLVASRLLEAFGKKLGAEAPATLPSSN